MTLTIRTVRPNDPAAADLVALHDHLESLAADQNRSQVRLDTRSDVDEACRLCEARDLITSVDQANHACRAYPR